MILEHKVLTPRNTCYIVAKCDICQETLLKMQYTDEYAQYHRIDLTDIDYICSDSCVELYMMNPLVYPEIRIPLLAYAGRCYETL